MFTLTIGFPLLDVIVAFGALLGAALVASGIREAYISSPAVTLASTGVLISGVILSIAAGTIAMADVGNAFVSSVVFLWERYSMDELVPTIGSWIDGVRESAAEGIEDWKELLG